MHTKLSLTHIIPLKVLQFMLELPSFVKLASPYICFLNILATSASSMHGLTRLTIFKSILQIIPQNQWQKCRDIPKVHLQAKGF